MVNVASCAVTRADVVGVTICKTHILASLLHGTFNTHLLHGGVGRYLGLDMVTLEDVCQRKCQGEESYNGDSGNDGDKYGRHIFFVLLL